MRELTKREMLRLGVGGVSAALLAACGRVVEEDVPLASPTRVDLPTPSPLAPADASPQTDPSVPGPTPRPSPQPATTPKPTFPPFEYQSDVRITPIESFCSYTYHPQQPPVILDFELRVFGFVRNVLNLSLDDLKAMPVVEEMRTLECISNPVGGRLISNAVWRGVPTAHLLDLAGVRAGAVELKFECADGYHTSIPVALAKDPHSFLAYRINGVPLAAKHSHPVERCGRDGTARSNPNGSPVSS